MKGDVIELESRLLSEAVYYRYGYDFRQYQIGSLAKRFEIHARSLGLKNISSLIPLVLHDRLQFQELLFSISVTVTSMFRDPRTFQDTRELVLPFLSTFPYLNIWHAGCATGEEAYSMAILLQEEGLLNRSQIYATDINERSLEVARKGIYPIKELRGWSRNYLLAGCKNTLNDYYHSRYSAAKLHESLQKKIVFSNHNLVSDGVFAEMQLVICKNVLIYFNQKLQHRVLKILTDSLCRNGYLWLGENESLDLTAFRDHYEVVSRPSKIYKKVTS